MFSPENSSFVTKHLVITSALLKRIFEEVIATRYEQPVCITIVDATGNQLGMYRDPEAGVHTVTASFRKAFTAASQKRSTVEIAQGIKENKIPKYIVTLHPEFTIMPGGVPIVVDGQVIGAIGVGGLHGIADHRLATHLAGLVFEEE